MSVVPPSAEDALYRSCAAAGGSLQITPLAQVEPTNVVAVKDASGKIVANITMTDDPNKPITIALPDGTLVATLQTGEHPEVGYGLKGSAGATVFDDVTVGSYIDPLFFCKGQLTAGYELKKSGKTVLLFEPSSHPWVPFFLLGTACLGACCAHCMASGPVNSVQLDGKTVGDMTEVHGNLCVQSEDAQVLRASINVFAHTMYMNFFSGGA